MSVEDVKAWEQGLLAGPVLDVVGRECLGVHGYGTGRVISAQVSGPPLAAAAVGPDGHPATPIVGGCDACERAGDCWTMMRDVARALLPEMMAEVDEIVAAGHKGAGFLAEWASRTGQAGRSIVPPPDLLLESLHVKIGAEHTVRLLTG